MINCIKDYDNYDIAVITEHRDDFFKGISFNIQERNSVFLYVLGLNEGETDIQFLVTEPIIIKSFMEYYNSLLEKISPINKDKDDIIAWIQDNIDILKDKLHK